MSQMDLGVKLNSSNLRRKQLLRRLELIGIPEYFVLLRKLTLMTHYDNARCQ